VPGTKADTREYWGVFEGVATPPGGNTPPGKPVLARRGRAASAVEGTMVFVLAEKKIRLREIDHFVAASAEHRGESCTS
jgi:hypothetical protein